MKKTIFYFVALMFGIVVLFLGNLLVGSVTIPLHDALQLLFSLNDSAARQQIMVEHPAWNYILWANRLPQAFTAVLAGSSLSVCGLLLQTTFRNPLASPGVFGVTSGAGLGVALVMLLLGGDVLAAHFSLMGFIAVLVAAFAGAMLVTMLIFVFSWFIKSSVMLLIVGIMVGYLSGAAISLLNFFANGEAVKSYVVWGMGDFGSVSPTYLPAYAAVVGVALMLTMTLAKPLNALLLGEDYAANLGVNVRHTRHALLLLTGLLTAVTTAFCGPIAFIGLAVPHLARLLLTTDNHRLLLPATMVMGAFVALLCCLLCHVWGSRGIIPLNAVTPLIGAPVVIYVILKNR